MSKNTALKSTFQLLSILFFFVLTPAACAQPYQLTQNVTNENGTVDSWNYTVHTINPNYYSLCLLPGKSETFNVSFRNEGNELLNIAPKVVATPYGYNNVNASWITISPANTTVSPGIEQDFIIEINVPDDAESGDYQAQIAFTDDTYPVYEDPVIIEEYSYPQYVNTLFFGITVPVLPKLELQTSYISDTIEPGKEYVYEIKMKNVAGKDVTIDPKVVSYDMYDCYSYEGAAFENDIIEISAPSVIKAGEITSMTIQVPVPENADGSYHAYIEMNADGKEYDGSVPQINLDFAVIKQLSVPYVKTFNTTTKDPITIKISTDIYGPESSVRISPKKEMPAFEVNLKCNSSPVKMALMETTQGGTVYSPGCNFPLWAVDNSSYDSYSGQYLQTYKVSGATGAWELSILPKNTNSFTYSITVGDSENKLK
jgi:hypothetical protein